MQDLKEGISESEKLNDFHIQDTIKATDLVMLALRENISSNDTPEQRIILLETLIRNAKLTVDDTGVRLEDAVLAMVLENDTKRKNRRTLAIINIIFLILYLVCGV